MYQLHAFNARGEQLSEYNALDNAYHVTFAYSDDYSVITWSMSATAGIKSGCRIDLNDGSRADYDAPVRWVRNRIAYFEILDGPYLLARAVRETGVNGRTTIEIRPVVGTGEAAREGDGRYRVQYEGTGGGATGGQYVARFCFSASKPDGGWIGAADEARDAYALARAHYAERHPSPDQAASEAYQAMMGDPFGPSDPHMPTGDAQSDAPARSEAPADNATPAPAPAVTEAFTPNPYWGDEETYGVALEAGFGAAGVAIYRATDGRFLEFAITEGPDNDADRAMRDAGYQGPVVNAASIDVSRETWHAFADRANWPATSDKFSNGLAERLYDSDWADDTMGDVEGFGHYSLFLADCAILATDSQGFVTVEAYGTEAATQYAWDTLAGHYERHCMSAMEDALPTGECEEIFLIFDTARHVNATPDRDEIREHVWQCRICQPYRYVTEEF